MKRQGACMCGAVRFEITSDVTEAAACHCGMCRKFTGGVFLAVTVPSGGLVFDSDDALGVFKSSDWAERGFCKTCGSSLFYRLTVPGPMRGEVYLGLGTLDDANGVPLTTEIYMDRKPDGYCFAGKTNKMTEAEVVALFAPSTPD